MAVSPGCDRKNSVIRIVVTLFSLTLPWSLAVNAQTLDLVFEGGRVIDPESGIDAIRNVGIRHGKIVAVSREKLTGKENIDVGGLVVAPGFIDIHAHGQNIHGQTYQVMDGVTTAMDLEIGQYPLDVLANREGRSYIHYGYSAGHWKIRHEVKGGDSKRAFHEVAGRNELERILRLVEAELKKGAIGIGLGLDYFSLGVSDQELEGLFRLAAGYRQPLFVHIRMPDDAQDTSGLAQLIEMSRKTRAALHMVHITSTGLQRTAEFLDMMDRARAEGLNITTELYPYTAGSTGIGYGIFDHDWQRKFGIGYRDVEWAETGERFSGRRMWEERRGGDPDKQVIMHMMKEEWVEQTLKHPDVMVASDGMWMSSLDQRVHPRGIGTFARILGLYVREKKTLNLRDAIRKISYLQAKLLEGFVPQMKHKGRIRPGADADITVFDPAVVIDKATFREPNRFSQGIVHVAVAGELVVRSRALQTHILPGKPIRTALYGKAETSIDTGY